MAIETENPGYIAAAAYVDDPNNVDVPDPFHGQFDVGVLSYILATLGGGGGGSGLNSTGVTQGGTDANAGGTASDGGFLAANGDQSMITGLVDGAGSRGEAVSTASWLHCFTTTGASVASIGAVTAGFLCASNNSDITLAGSSNLSVLNVLPTTDPANVLVAARACFTVAEVGDSAGINQRGNGGFMHGDVADEDSLLSLATGANGGRVGGYARNGGVLEGSALGAWVHGVVDNATAEATASCAGQFAEGSNGEPNSFAVGSSMRLNGNAVAPSTIRNGDMWCDGTDVFVRTNGVTKNLSNVA